MEISKNIKLILFLILQLSTILPAQISESLLKDIRYATEDYNIAYDTILIKGSKRLPCLQVMINDHGPYKFLIDLGSNVVNFKESVVNEAEIKIVLDREKGGIAVADSIQIGISVFYNVYGAVYTDLDVDGVLGYNFISKSNFMMDYINMKFAFVKEISEKDSSEYISYTEIGRMPYIRSKIGKKNVFINFDTGASGWVYFPSNFKDSLNLKSQMKYSKKVWNNQNGVTRSTYSQLNDNIIFGPFLIVKPTIMFLPDIDDIFIGSSLLNDFILTFFPGKLLLKMERNTKSKSIVTPKNWIN